MNANESTTRRWTAENPPPCCAPPSPYQHYRGTYCRYCGQELFEAQCIRTTPCAWCGRTICGPHYEDREPRSRFDARTGARLR